MERTNRLEGMLVCAKKTLFFFFLCLIAFAESHVYVNPNVYIGYNNVTFLFQNNNTPLWFTQIEIWEDRIRYNKTDICITPPAFIYVYDYPDIFNFACCYNTWVANYTSCNTTDQQIKYYYDTNNCFFPNNLPVDNGTTVSCNYCSESIYPTYGECLDNSTQSIDYVDLNQLTCCDATNIPSDCSIRTYPYNTTTYQGCNSTNANIGLANCRKNPEISNRIREDCVVEIPEQYKNDNYKCFSIVKEKDTGEIVQVNPDQNRTNPVWENREFFTPLYSTINFYYTAENLEPEKEYLVRVECSSPERIIYSEYTIERSYENLSWIFYRIRWLIGNAQYIIGGIVLFAVIISALLLIKKIVS